MNQAVILAGGRGERLRPLTDRTQKVMLPVAGRPFLELLLRYLLKEGITHVVFLAAYLHEQIEAYFGNGRKLGMNIVYDVAPGLLGTGGALRHALPLLRQRFFVMNGDTYARIPLLAMEGFHARNQFLATIALSPQRDTSRFGKVELRNNRVVRFREKAPLSTPGLINAGAYFLERTILEVPTEQKFSSLERDYFPQLAEKGQVGGFVFQGYFVDTGTLESYHQFVREVQSNKHEYDC